VYSLMSSQDHDGHAATRTVAGPGVGTRELRGLGWNGLGRDDVAAIQRARLLAAMFDVVWERGAAHVTVADVSTRSGVSRRTFYELFDDRDDCLLAAFDEAIDRVEKVVIPAYEGPGQWREKIRNALCGLLGVFDQEPGIARLLVVESLAAGPLALQRRAHILKTLTKIVDEGRETNSTTREIPALTAEGVVGAVLSVIHARLVSEDSRPLMELAGPLMGIIVLPYLGPSAARKEIERPTPQTPETQRATGDPLRGLPMRLTYRTIRVLIAIAEQPGCSNRQIGHASGMQDQGQISKLLARLQRLGLIQNTGEGHTKGAPNAWTLTTTGHEIQHTITHA
jgi:AcrR family transcriptional regulator